jgi:hypothetical protein
MRFIEILAGKADVQNHDLMIRAIGEDGKETELRFASAAIGSLIALALSEAGKLPNNPYKQIMTLTNAQLFQVQAPDRVGLELHFDQGIRLPVLFPRIGIVALRKALSAVEALGKQRRV